MRLLLFISILINSALLFGQAKHTPTPDSLIQTYEEVIAGIKKDKANLKTNNISKDSCRVYLLDKFENHVFPHWIGTQWDYNGYTNKPGKDKLVACGYFVSTTLKHMGFNWNRFDLAKMYSLNIVQNTCSDIQKYSDKKELISYIISQPNNLYIVGLDSHVGFILKSKRTVWFVHSNYYGAIGPQKELASTSPALNDSYNYYVGTFFNDLNIEKWLNGTSYTFSE